MDDSREDASSPPITALVTRSVQLILARLLIFGVLGYVVGKSPPTCRTEGHIAA